MEIKRNKKSSVVSKIIMIRTRKHLEDFRQYTQEIEYKFNAEKEALLYSYNAAIKGLPDHEISEIDDYFSDDYYIIEDIHIDMYRKATLVSIYSFLEYSMNQLCKHLCLVHKYPVQLDDLRGEGIVRARNYLEKLAEVEFKPLNGEWSHLKILNKIRNCIVHAEGNIKASHKESQLEKIVENNSNLSLRSERYVKIEREYIDFCINKVENFLDKLYRQVFAT